MPQKITVSISPDGTTEVEAHGVKGQGCTALTEAIEQALGDIRNRELKPEFKMREPGQGQQVKQS